jgi:hypothetical protein
MTTRLPLLLDDLRIATPCQADWNEMTGDDRVRFCGRCEKNVYNLSAMTRDQAESLVREKEGRLCVRLYRRQDGTVLTADCPVGVERRRLRQRMWASVSSVAASVALLAGLWSGRARADLTLRKGDAVRDGKKPEHPTAVVPMGGAVVPPERLMGKVMVPVVEPKAPKKPTPLMGEPVMIQGDVSVGK